MKPTQEEIIESLKYQMEEDFFYCFNGYSNWKEVKDETFHEFRQNYLDAAKKLEEYIQTL